MKIIYNKLIPPKGYMAINLFGLLFIRKEYKNEVEDYVINHERIHTRQMLELLIIPFYLIYLLEWLFRLIYYRNQNKAYRSISFEREAYIHQYNLHYIKRRKHFAWRKYLRIRQ